MEFQYEDFSAQTEKKGRVYHSPGGEFPSITTVLNKTRDNTWLYEWRKRVGAEKANEIAAASAARGTKIHKHMEDHMDGKEVDLSNASEDEVQMSEARE